MKNILKQAVIFAAALCGISAAFAQESATPEEAITKVWAAAKFLQDKGPAGFATLNSKDGPFAWKDSYVFAFDCRLDRMVAHPMRPDLVGQPIMQITDNNGRFIFKEMCKAAQEKRGGWVEYVWTKPGAGKVSRKLTYVATAQMAFSTGIQLGAGVYDEKLTVAGLNQLVGSMADPSKRSAP
ncbi:MAG: cache domain-containing protein [Ignavibacteria bacterium]